MKLSKKQETDLQQPSALFEKVYALFYQELEKNLLAFILLEEGEIMIPYKKFFEKKAVFYRYKPALMVMLSLLKQSYGEAATPLETVNDGSPIPTQTVVQTIQSEKDIEIALVDKARKQIIDYLPEESYGQRDGDNIGSYLALSEKELQDLLDQNAHKDELTEAYHTLRDQYFKWVGVTTPEELRDMHIRIFDDKKIADNYGLVYELEICKLSTKLSYQKSQQEAREREQQEQEEQEKKRQEYWANRPADRKIVIEHHRDDKGNILFDTVRIIK